MRDAESFSVKIPLDDPDSMQDFNAMMDALQDMMISEAEGLAEEIGVSTACALDVIYLRSRSRWTNELENELIDLHKQGIRPNMNDFSVNEESQAKMRKAIAEVGERFGH